MRILVTGSSGMIGTELKRQVKDDVLYLSRSHGTDVLDYEGMKKAVFSYRPDIIMHLAAKTDVDWCEHNEKACYEVNVGGTENMAKIAGECASAFVYPSTFYVYSGGGKDIYDDRIDSPKLNNISSVYSRSKFLAEEVVRLRLKRYFILRLGALFGGGIKDKKFVSKIINTARNQREIRVVDDRITQPSSIKDTVKNMLALLKTDKYGTYNMVGHGSASYLEYARSIIEFSGFKDINLIPIKSSDFPEAAAREKKLAVINGKLRDAGLDLMRDWRVALKEYIGELKEEGQIL